MRLIRLPGLKLESTGFRIRVGTGRAPSSRVKDGTVNANLAMVKGLSLTKLSWGALTAPILIPSND